MANPRLRTLVLVAGLGTSLAWGSNRLALGDEPVKLEGEARATSLLHEVIAAYRALPAYGDQGEFVLSMVVGGQSKTQRKPLHLTLVRPNKLSLDTGLARIVCDGKTLTTIVTPLKKYSSSPAPKSVTYDTVFTDGPVGSAVFGGPSSPMMLILLNLLLGADPTRSFLDLGDRISLTDDRPIDGQPCRVLKLSSSSEGGGNPAFFLMIDPATKLLKAIDLSFDAKALAEVFPEGQGVKVDIFRWLAGPVTTAPAADPTFAFDPPKDYARFDAGTGAAAKGAAAEDDDQKFKVQTFLGKVAPDFTLTVFDGEGKTKTLSRADLAGKIVLLDFWATWCGPCLKELPQIQALIEGYAKDKKDVLIVAVSQDNDPKEPVAVRKLIESTLEKQKLNLTLDPVGKVALDPSNSVGEAFQVEGYPTVVVLDAKGIVRAAHVGYSAEVGKTLGREVDALLDGKAIGNDKPDDKK